MGSLTSRVALVTGGGRGIGRATARALAAEGAKTIVTARSRDELSAVVAEIESAAGVASAIQCDLSDRAQTLALVERARALYGDVDILVNNAGIGSSGDLRPLAEFSDSFWDQTLEVNVTAPYLLSKAVLPPMRAQGWGRIITIASINGRVPAMHAGAYVASKHAVMGLMRALALEHAAEGITVNSVCPGPVESRMNNIRIQHDAERLGRTLAEQEHQSTPRGGRLQPEDIAPMVCYLCGESARMITGQSYNIDGGLCMA